MLIVSWAEPPGRQAVYSAQNLLHGTIFSYELLATIVSMSVSLQLLPKYGPDLGSCASSHRASNAGLYCAALLGLHACGELQPRVTCVFRAEQYLPDSTAVTLCPVITICDYQPTWAHAHTVSTRAKRRQPVSEKWGGAPSIFQVCSILIKLAKGTMTIPAHL